MLTYGIADGSTIKYADCESFIDEESVPSCFNSVTDKLLLY